MNKPCSSLFSYGRFLRAGVTASAILLCTSTAWGDQADPVLTIAERPAPVARQQLDRPAPPAGDRGQKNRGFLGKGRLTADNHLTLEPEAATNSYKKQKGEHRVGAGGGHKSLPALQAENRLGGVFIEDHVAQHKRAINTGAGAK